jgi:hypothetical protein
MRLPLLAQASEAALAAPSRAVPGARLHVIVIPSLVACALYSVVPLAAAVIGGVVVVCVVALASLIVSLRSHVRDPMSRSIAAGAAE